MNEALSRGDSRDASPVEGVGDDPRNPSWLLFVMGCMFACASLEWVTRDHIPPPTRPPKPIDLSTAPARELRRLTGIGPSRSAAIVETRWERAGQAFALREVPGIGARIESRALEGLASH